MLIRKQDDNALAEAFKLMKGLWRHREGVRISGRQIDQVTILGRRIELENRLPGAVMDTIDALYPEGRPRPLLSQQKRTSTGWHMVFTLQPGISAKDISKRLDYFTSACRAQVTMEMKGGFLHLDLWDGEMQTYYPYEWEPGPYLKDMDLPVPIGYTPAGLAVVDLAALPHMRVGGTTFTGKSNFLHTLFISLAMLPRVRLAVIDLALLEFSYVRNHAAFAADTITALRLLTALEREMHRRRKVLDATGVVKIQDYTGEDLPFIVLVIDEFAFVNPDGAPDKDEKELRKGCQVSCSNLAALARKVGIHLVLAMQRPDMKILPGQLKANLPGALSFKTINVTNSEIILDNGAAAELPDIKGRAIWQVGHRQVELQTMHLPVTRARDMLRKITPEVMTDDGGSRWDVEPAPKRLPAR